MRVRLMKPMLSLKTFGSRISLDATAEIYRRSRSVIFGRRGISMRLQLKQRKAPRGPMARVAHEAHFLCRAKNGRLLESQKPAEGMNCLS